MAERLLVATTNPGKLREIRTLMEGLPIDLVGLDDIPAVDAPEETGATFDENARLKAEYYSRVTGLRAVAEDSGGGRGGRRKQAGEADDPHGDRIGRA